MQQHGYFASCFQTPGHTYSSRPVITLFCFGQEVVKLRIKYLWASLVGSSKHYKNNCFWEAKFEWGHVLISNLSWGFSNNVMSFPFKLMVLLHFPQWNTFCMSIMTLMFLRYLLWLRIPQPLDKFDVFVYTLQFSICGIFSGITIIIHQ